MRNISRTGMLIACLVLSAGLAAVGCKSKQANQAATDQSQDANDPANANVVPISNVSTGTAASGQTDQTPNSSGQSNQPNTNQYDSNQYNQDNGYGEEPETYAQQAPPELPEYQQPPCPEDGDIWTPGFWAWAEPSGYYWVPGAWVRAPYAGALWTPPYWGWRNGRYAFYRGYWGRHVGFYGGINYGFGYVGFGYRGGYWRGNEFAYNTAVNRVDTMVVHNVYNYRITNATVTRVSYNGPGGLQYRPRAAEVVAIREEHNPPMAAQVQLRMSAQTNRENFYSANRGRPSMVVETHAIAADREVRPPAVVNYARGERPAEQRAMPEAHPVGPEPGRQVGHEPARPGERPQPRPSPEHPQAGHPQARPAEHQHTPPQRPEDRRPPDRRAEPERRPQ